MTKNNVVMAVRYLIHDWLYTEKEVADKFNDGKDKPIKKYVLMNVEDADKNEMPSSDCIMMFENAMDCIQELNESIE